MFKRLFFALLIGLTIVSSNVPATEASEMNVAVEMESRIEKMRGIGSLQVIRCEDAEDVKAAIDFIENDERVNVVKVTKMHDFILVRFVRIK